jgi:hypothetical protein
MSAPSPTLCFTCGLPLGDPPRLNHLPGGQVCPSCRDRLLDHLPALLPGGLRPEEAWEEAWEEVPSSSAADGPRRLEADEATGS